MAISLNSTSSGSDTSTQTLTYSHTVNAGSNKILIVGVTIEVDTGNPLRTISTVVFNTNESLTKIDAQEYDSRDETSLWYLLNPTATTANIVVTASADPGADSGIVSGAVTINGAEQQAHEATAKATGTGTDIGVLITTITDDAWVLDSVGLTRSSINMAPDAGQTERWEEAAECRGNGSTRPVAVAAQVNMGWTAASSYPWGIVAASFEEYSVPSAGILQHSTVLAQRRRILSGGSNTGLPIL